MIDNKIKKEKKIDTIKELRLKKMQLKRKSEKKSKKIKKKLKKLTSQSNVQDVYNELLSEFNLQHSLLNMLPLVLKYKNQLSNIKISKKNKSKIFISLGAVSSAILTYFLLSNKKSNNINNENNNTDKSEKGENFENNLFI